MINDDDFFARALSIKIQKDDPVQFSYAAFVNFFESKGTLTSEDVLVGAHMVYGWMPTMLNLHLNNDGLIRITSLLNRAKIERALQDKELEELIKAINNSLVGVSKLLHFILPETFAIWDARVYHYFKRETPYSYRLNDVEIYRKYIQELLRLTGNNKFKEVKERIETQLQYHVSPLRAAEMVMFMKAG